MTVLNLSVCKYWLLGVGLLVSIGQVSAVQFVKAPEISKNPNDRVPLAAVLSFETDVPVSTLVEVNDGVKSEAKRS